MELLYLKDYKWVLSQNELVRIDFLGYRRYELLAKHIKPFFQKKLKRKDAIAPTIGISIFSPLKSLDILFCVRSWDFEQVKESLFEKVKEN